MRKSCLYTAIQAIKEYGGKSMPLNDKNATEGNSRNVSVERLTVEVNKFISFKCARHRQRAGDFLTH